MNYSVNRISTERAFSFFSKCLWLALILLISLNSRAEDIKWLGGVLNANNDAYEWSNANNWVCTSCTSPPYNRVPTIDDDVLFDAAGDYDYPVQISTNASMRDMVWDVSGYSGSGFPHLKSFNNCTQNIAGDIELSSSSDMLFGLHNRSTTNMKYGTASNRTIDLVDHVFPGIINFEQANITWTFLSDFIANYVVNVNSGIVEFPSYSEIYVFNSQKTSARTIDLTGSIVEITGYGESLEFRNTSNLTLIEANSIIRFMNTEYVVGPYADNLDFNEMQFLQGVEAVFTGEGNTFQEIWVAGQLHLQDENVINTLDLQAGSVLILQPTHTQFVTNIIAIGDCSGHIMIQSLWSGTPAEIEWSSSSNPMTLQEVYIEDVILTNGPSSIGGVFYNLTNSPGWGTGSSGGYDFYWIGSTGNWSDASNWGIAPLYTNPNNCLPGPNDNVYFNGLVSGISPVISVDDLNVFCKSMDWTGVANIPDFVSADVKNTVNVYGSLTLDNSAVMSWTYDGNVEFRSHQTPLQTLNFADQSLVANFQMNGSGGSWTMLTDLVTSGSLDVDGGSFYSNGMNYDGYAFRSKARNPREVHLENTSVFTVEKWDLNSAYNEFNNVYNTSSDPYLSSALNTFTAANSQVYVTKELASTGRFLDYYDFEMTTTNTSEILSTYQTTFHDLKIDCDVKVANAGGSVGVVGISNRLIFTEGHEYKLEGTYEFGSNGELVADGNCLKYIEIIGGVFEKPLGSNPILVDYCIIEDNIVQNSVVTFTADFSILTNTTGWIGGSEDCTEYHFKATTSQLWSDPGNWYPNASLSGANSGCIPGPRSDVYFYENSFDATFPDMEILTDNAYCRDITMEAGSNWLSPEFLGQNIGASNNKQELNIFGSLKFVGKADAMWSYLGQLRFRSVDGALCPSPTTRTVNTNDQDLFNRVYFEMAPTHVARLEHDLQFADNSTMEMIWVNQGFFEANTHTISCYGFISDATQMVRGVDLSNSVLNAKSTIRFNPTNLTFDAIPSEINLGILNSPFGFLSTSDLDYDVVNFHGGYGNIGGSDNTFLEVTFHEDGNFNGSNEFEVLNLTSDKSYVFMVGETQTIVNNNGNGALNAIGTQGDMIIMESSSETVESFIDSEVPICVKYVQMRGLWGDYLGFDETFKAESSINVENNNGWAFQSCVNEAETACVGQGIIFDQPIVSVGPPTWYFGDGTSVTQYTPTHVYATAGNFTVTAIFAVIGSSENPSYDALNIDVYVDESCCEASDFPSHAVVSGIINTDVVWGDQILVTDDVFVQDGALLDVTNSDVVFFDNKGIYVEDGSRLVATNSTLRPCEEGATWAGIDFDDQSSGAFTDNVFIQPEIGIELNTTATVDVTSNQFLNFHKAVFVGNTSNTMMDHMISGNEMTLNRYVDDLSYPTTEFYGIELENAWISPAISLNNFHYTFIDDGGKEGYGIYLNTSSANCTDNDFTNVFYPYFQVNSSNICSFDGNEISYNASFGTSAGQSVTEPVAITIEGGSMMTSIFNNDISSVSGYVNLNTGIYVNQTTNILVDHNTIEGFSFGIQGLASAMKIENNALTNCDAGIVAEGSSDLLIKSNQIDESSMVGIGLENCFSTTSILDNVIDAEWGEPAVGIIYDVNTTGATSTVNIESNCILDCESAMQFHSNTQCSTIPRIRNNYLYNYSMNGIFNDNYDGDIGVNAADPGRNSFISNTSTGIDIFNLNDPFCTVNTEGNWPDQLSTNLTPMVQANPQMATTSCGRQTESLRLELTSKLLEEVEANYAVEFDAGEVLLTDQTMNVIASKDEDAQFSHAAEVLNLMLSNDNITGAQSFVDLVISDLDFSQSELSILKYQLRIKEGDWIKANVELRSVSDIEFSALDVELEKVKVQLFSDNRSIYKMTDAELGVLQSINDVSNSVYSRVLLHEAMGDHVYIYKHPTINTASSSSQTAALAEEIVVYPNPTSDHINVQINRQLEESAVVQIWDSYGKLISSQVLPGLMQNGVIDLSNLSAGFYIMTVSEGDNVSKLPIQVMR